MMYCYSCGKEEVIDVGVRCKHCKDYYLDDIDDYAKKLLKITLGFKDVPMPNPTEEELKSPLFQAIFQIIKTWDVNVPEYYDGYCSANGSHVVVILREVEKNIKERIAGTLSGDWTLDILGIPSDGSLGSAVKTESFCGWCGQEGNGHVKEKRN